MSRAVDIARYIYDYYKSINNENIDEMKLHKLLYFSQREKLAITNDILFDDRMEGWKYGPVVPTVRACFSRPYGVLCDTNQISEEDAYIVRNVVSLYGTMSSLNLKDMSHDEYSWKHSREGLGCKDTGNRELLIDDIKKDAEKIRPFDYAWGMYYDEFEDLEEAQ